MSAPLPGPSGTMNRTLRCGHAVCAAAGIASKAASRSGKAAHAARSATLILVMIVPNIPLFRNWQQRTVTRA
jgi:hypothetical protein